MPLTVRCKPASLRWNGYSFVHGRDVVLHSAGDIAAAKLCPDLECDKEVVLPPKEVLPPQPARPAPPFPDAPAPAAALEPSSAAAAPPAAPVSALAPKKPLGRPPKVRE